MFTKKSKYRQNLEKRTVSAFENRVSGSVFLTCFWWLFKTNSGMLLYSTTKNDLKHRVRATGHARLTLKRRNVTTTDYSNSNNSLSLTHFEVNSSLFRFVCNNTHLNKWGLYKNLNMKKQAWNRDRERLNKYDCVLRAIRGAKLDLLIMHSLFLFLCVYILYFSVCVCVCYTLNFCLLFWTHLRLCVCGLWVCGVFVWFLRLFFVTTLTHLHSKIV